MWTVVYQAYTKIMNSLSVYKLDSWLYENHTIVPCRSSNELYDNRFSVIDYGYLYIQSLTLNPSPG